MFQNFYEGKKVFITGHTGFKGSWICAWLLRLGAEICGYSNGVPTTPSNFKILGIEKKIHNVQGDICDYSSLLKAIQEFNPEIVIHLAAQSLVGKSYQQPVETIKTNALGTLNLLDCMRQAPSIRAGVFITGDKCYKNVEWIWGYRENDILGGDDPYSSSKGCAELIIHSYIKSYFNKAKSPAIASARAGNAIGGGDWAENRIIPDAVRAWSKGNTLIVRNLEAKRPWQHVLEPLSGYLWLGKKLFEKDINVVGQAFNFGPDAKIDRTVFDLLSEMQKNWPEAKWEEESNIGKIKKEATLLKLNCDKALTSLGWRAILSFEETVKTTAVWYKTYYDGHDGKMAKMVDSQIKAYENKALREGLLWAY